MDSTAAERAAWRRAGRAAAWANGVGFVVAGVLATAASSGIPPTEPDPVRHYAYVRSIWPELYVAFITFLAAFLALIPMGLALHELFGKARPRVEFMWAALLAAGIVGALWMLVQIGSAQATVNQTGSLSPTELRVFGAASAIWSGTINWLQRGFLLLASLGTFWASRPALETRLLPRSWAWLGLVLTGFYWLGLAILIVRDVGLAAPDTLGTGLVLLGSLLAAAWAAWLGWCLGTAFAPRPSP